MLTRRDQARDLVRGLTLLEMSFVNISAHPWSNHSGYIDQPTYVDTIFPCFAFLAGMSRTSTRRSVGLIGLGLGLNVIGAYSRGESVRIPGVLQRLGLSSLIHNENIFSALRRWYCMPLLILWYSITILYGSTNPLNPFAHPDYPGADPSTTAQTKIDTACFGDRIYTVSYDPEGLLGALTTVLSMTLGQSFAHSNLSKLAKALAATGMILSAEALHLYVPRFAPISKSLWTPSFVLITSALVILKYLLLEMITPLMPRIITRSLSHVGQRSLEVYLMSTVLELALQHGQSKSIWTRSLSFIAQYTGRGVADLIMSLGFTASMALAATFMVNHRIRLSW